MSKIIAVLLLLFTGTVALAQENIYPPKAILIKLNTRHKAIAFLNEKGNTARAALLRKDAATLNEKLMADWKDHFDYCPVYFFPDTTLSDVLAGRYNSVFDTAGRQVDDSRIAQLDGKFYIAYLGARSQEDYLVADATPGSTQLPGLIVCDSKLKTLADYQLGSSANGDVVSFLFPGRGEKKYRFRSRYFEMDYFPVAEKYQKKLRKYWER